MSIKKGAEVNGLRPEMVIALMIAGGVYSEYDIECVLTEGSGAKHGNASLHYVGLAIDLRTRNIPANLREEIADRIRRALGEQYDVVLESDHIHIEYQPK